MQLPFASPFIESVGIASVLSSTSSVTCDTLTNSRFSKLLAISMRTIAIPGFPMQLAGSLPGQQRLKCVACRAYRARLLCDERGQGACMMEEEKKSVETDQPWKLVAGRTIYPGNARPYRSASRRGRQFRLAAILKPPTPAPWSSLWVEVHFLATLPLLRIVFSFLFLP